MIFVISFSFPDRDQIPLQGNSGLLKKAKFYMSFAVYLLRDRDHMWQARFGGEINIVKGLSFMAHMEFIADPYSPIFFRPRGIYFSEGLVYYFKKFGIGYIHRCKHDVDALNRTLILSGPRIYTLLNDISIYVDFYPIRYDKAYPDIDRFSLKNLIASVGGNLSTRYFVAYIKVDISKYGLHPFGGFTLRGYIGEDLRIYGFLNIERFYDTGLNRASTPAILGNLGISGNIEK